MKARIDKSHGKVKNERRQLYFKMKSKMFPCVYKPVVTRNVTKYFFIPPFSSPVKIEEVEQMSILSFFSFSLWADLFFPSPFSFSRSGTQKQKDKNLGRRWENVHGARKNPGVCWHFWA